MLPRGHFTNHPRVTRKPHPPLLRDGWGGAAHATELIYGYVCIATVTRSYQQLRITWFWIKGEREREKEIIHKKPLQSQLMSLFFFPALSLSPLVLTVNFN